MPRATTLPRGLNDNHKKGERERIDRENQALLRRLQDVMPSIDHEKNEDAYALHCHLIAEHQKCFVSNPFLAPGTGSRAQSASSTRRRPASRSSAGRPASAASDIKLLNAMAGSSYDPNEAMRETSKLLGPPSAAGPSSSSAGIGGLPAVAESPGGA